MSPEMLKYCRGARNRYRNYLDERKIQDTIGEEERSKEELKKILESEKKKAGGLERDVKKTTKGI